MRTGLVKILAKPLELYRISQQVEHAENRTAASDLIGFSPIPVWQKSTVGPQGARVASGLPHHGHFSAAIIRVYARKRDVCDGTFEITRK